MLKFILIIFFVSYAKISIANIINKIDIEGNLRLDDNTIFSYLNINSNTVIPKSDLNILFKDLFATELFSEIKFKLEDSKLTIIVKENPIINRIALEGNKRLEDEDIFPEISLKIRDVFTKNKIQNNLQRILALYRASGRYAAIVEPKVIYLKQNRVDIVFEITEGPLSKIDSIKFLGNRYYSDSRLKREITTSEARWWKILTAGGKYDPDLLNFDKENLKKFYADQGFVDAEVSLAVGEISNKKDKFYITFVVNEGDRYKFGNVNVDIEIKNYNKSDILKSINIKKNNWYSATRVDENITKLTESLIDSGSPFINIIPKLDRKKNNIIDVKFIIKPGQKKYINKIIISGNTRTLDKVIRRTIRLAEGDPYNRNLINRSRTLVTNLGHFSYADIEVSDNFEQQNTVDLNVKVKEQSTGSLVLGGGFSSAVGATANIGISENNLLGKSQKLRLNLIAGQRENRADFSFTEPFFLDRSSSLTTNLFTTVQEFPESNYDNERDGAEASISYNVGEFGSQSLGYRVESRNIIAEDAAAASIKSISGESVLSVFTFGNAIDKTNNRIDPKDGWAASNRLSFAGLGGDKRYFKTTFRGSIYNEIWNEKAVAALSGQIGYILGLSQNIDISDRFYLGGNSFVGFQNAGLGPRDKDTDDSLGGNIYYTITPQLKFGLGLPKELGIRGRLFSTAGTLTRIDTNTSNYYDDGSIRLTAGAGVLWQSPFGPIRLDYTIPILKETHDKTETFSFNVGSLF
ncbi:MAG: Outer membrane protein assembly factor BamA [Alphaproteobacteria bacterium MarineAlpha9_Bin4]|nr:outer membrane protein assembly factor BamA [Pelagibacterales bacterium]PPR27550.1 MAG: Outer membrane protein assembly factor BamA [Alphaproteobacteria bacterium MarineAlpha9_Bin4]